MRILITRKLPETNDKASSLPAGFRQQDERGHDLLRLRQEWSWYRSTRERKAIYQFLECLFSFVQKHLGPNTRPETNALPAIARGRNPILAAIKAASENS